jgi:hypothetical protein
MIFFAGAVASELDSAEQKASSSHAESRSSQQKIDEVDDQIRTARAEYLLNERISDVTEAYNEQIGLLVNAQEHELADLQRQLDSIDETERSVLPMLNRMVDMLRQFVAADLPFLRDERQQRLKKLDAMLLRADVSIAEKYRRILEAYMVDVQYGRTFESYSGLFEAGGTSYQVTFLRLGRTALYYQTLNGQQSGVWQPSRNSWKPLTDAESLVLREAIQIARQLKVPDLLALPLPQPEARS